MKLQTCSGACHDHRKTVRKLSRCARSLFTNFPRPRRSSVLHRFRIRPLDFRHPPRRYSSHPCSTEGANSGGASLAERGVGACGFGLVSRASGGLGRHRPAQYVGPSGNGLVERMKAGESPWIKGVPYGRPCPSPEGGLRGLRKTPQWSAERRAGPRHGPAVPSRWRDRPDRKAGQRVRRFRAREFRSSASLFWDCEGFETDNLARQPAGMRRAATLPATAQQHAREELTRPKFRR